MTSKLISLATALAILASPAAAFASDGSSSSSSSSVSSDERTEKRVERCARFAKGDDYERCVRLIRRIPAKDDVETVDTTDRSSDEWKWTNIFNRLDDKLKGAIKFVSTMSKQFCRERTEDTSTTSRECMARIKTELKTRIDAILDEAFRADLPSSR